MYLPEAHVNSLLEKLMLVMEYKSDLIADANQHFVKLQEELEILKGLMKDFSNYNHHSDFLKQTVTEVRTILGEAEDAFDTYVLQAAAQKSRGLISRAFHKFTDYPKLLREVGKQIADIGDKVKQINLENITNGFEALESHDQAIPVSDPPGNTLEPKPSISIVEDDHVIGFKEPAEQVTKLLTEGCERLEVISIAGMLGMGKTTLAKKVYEDPLVYYEYEIQAFVHVSREYEKMEVLLEILSSFTEINDHMRKMGEKDLEKYVHDELKGKQYMVVLDDVWEKEDWDAFKGAFPINNKRCRVLITTRNGKVAEYANPVNPDSLYRMRFLGWQKSQKLLRWRVFHTNDCPHYLQEHEIDILEKCDGLPLALVIIAGLLVNHPNVSWWKYIANCLKDYVARDITQTSKVIELMYKNLPNHLKPCYLYLGVFPQAFEITVWKLMQLWISEGFIESKERIDLEVTAEEYLGELVQRNLVIIGQRRLNGKIKTCRLNSTVRAFCEKEASEENLYQKIKKDRLSFFLSEDPTVDEYRCLCMRNANILDYISGAPSGKRLRSFLTFSRKKTTVGEKLVSCIPKTFKLLRVLEAQSLIFTPFPVDLCNLVLLKYVAISSNFSSLPSAFSCLWNLQTLIVSTTSPTLEIKVDLWRMPQFRHLHTDTSALLPYPSTKSQKSSEEDSLGKNVRTLSTISPESCKKEVFHRTPNLKKLGIRGALSNLFKVSDGSSSLQLFHGLESLENLKLLNDDTSSKLNCLPRNKNFPAQLKELTLMNTRLEWAEMSRLKELDNLEVLKLKDYAFEGDLWNTGEGCFRSLKYLYIGRTDLVVWNASGDHFPKLESLKLNYCDKLQAVPLGLEDITSLQLVVLHCTNPQVASSARRLQELKLQQASRSYKSNILKVTIYPPGH